MLSTREMLEFLLKQTGHHVVACPTCSGRGGDEDDPECPKCEGAREVIASNPARSEAGYPDVRSLVEIAASAIEQSPPGDWRAAAVKRFAEVLHQDRLNTAALLCFKAFKRLESAEEANASLTDAARLKIVMGVLEESCE